MKPHNIIPSTGWIHHSGRPAELPGEHEAYYTVGGGDKRFNQLRRHGRRQQDRQGAVNYADWQINQIKMVIRFTSSYGLMLPLKVVHKQSSWLLI